jgi:hypothetical protein
VHPATREDANKKSFYSYSFLKVHLHHSLKIKKAIKNSQKIEIKVFLHFLLVDGRIWTRMRIQEAKNIRPEHCGTTWFPINSAQYAKFSHNQNAFFKYHRAGVSPHAITSFCCF